MSRIKKIKYSDIPLEFTIAHRNEAEGFCDKQTQIVCYCGRLATGLHTISCSKYRAHFQRYIENIYNNHIKESKKWQEKQTNF